MNRTRMSDGGEARRTGVLLHPPFGQRGVTKSAPKFVRGRRPAVDAYTAGQWTGASVTHHQRASAARNFEG